MGVEPTAARSARPATGFEDRGAHRDPATPVVAYRIPQLSEFVKRPRARRDVCAAKPPHKHLFVPSLRLDNLSLCVTIRDNMLLGRLYTARSVRTGGG